MPERNLACPHCRADITWQVQELVADELHDERWATTYLKCDECSRGFSVSVDVTVNINARSFEEAHPEQAAKYRAEKERRLSTLQREEKQ